MQQIDKTEIASIEKNTSSIPPVKVAEGAISKAQPQAKIKVSQETKQRQQIQ